MEHLIHHPEAHPHPHTFFEDHPVVWGTMKLMLAALITGGIILVLASATYMFSGIPLY